MNVVDFETIGWEIECQVLPVANTRHQFDREQMRQLRKVTKNRSLFPTDTSVLKLLYLATQEILKKWTMKIKHWNQILAQLSIHFKERVEEYL